MNKNMNWYGCLYCHTNLLNGKKYWGITTQKNPERRWRDGNDYKSCILFYRAIKKYGWDNFQHDIVTYCLDKETLDAAETYWIKATRSNEREFGYNLKSGGSRGKHSEETRKKMSDAHKGMKSTEESKKKMSISKKGNKNHNYGKSMSEETKLKVSKTLFGKNRGNKHPNFKGTIVATNIETGEIIELNGGIDIYEKGFSQSKVTLCIQGKRKSHKGYIFERISK